MTPTVLPLRSNPTSPSRLKFRSRMRSSAQGMCRLTARINAMVFAATVGGADRHPHDYANEERMAGRRRHRRSGRPAGGERRRRDRVREPARPVVCAARHAAPRQHRPACKQRWTRSLLPGLRACRSYRAVWAAPCLRRRLVVDEFTREVEVLENGTVALIECFHTVFEEAFEHLRYALRDLAQLE